MGSRRYGGLGGLTAEFRINEVWASLGSPQESLLRCDPPMGGRGNALDDFPGEAFAIVAFCHACGRFRPLECAALPGGLMIADLRRRLRCAACGSRETSIRIV
jgi:hypothetical protein